jgi:hypothetical protein
MPAGRGFLTVAALSVIALGCIAVARRLERERRLLRRLKASEAFAPGRSVELEQLSDDERDTAHSLAAAGVVRTSDGRCWLVPEALADHHRRRLRLALAGSLAALALGTLVAALMLG